MTRAIELLQAKAEELTAEVATLTRKINAYEEATKPKQPVTARVAIGECYTCISDAGNTYTYREVNDKVDQYRFDTGNYASDTPEGRAYLERKQRRDLAKVRLERKRDELGGFVTSGASGPYCIPQKMRGGEWSRALSGAASEFAFKSDGSGRVGEFISSMSADLDIYFGETV